MPYVTTPDGCRLHYAIHGPTHATAAPVVLIQGLGLSGKFWFDLPERLASESPLRVIVPDNRGTGLSERSPKLFRMQTLADDVAHVLEACDVKEAYVVGISMGGMIAQHLAIRHPQRVKGLVLMATTPGLPYGKIPPLKSLATLLTMPARVRGDTDDAALPIAQLLLPKKHWPRAREIFAGWGEVVQKNPLHPLAFFAQFFAVAAHSTGAQLSKITCPTYVITGDSDALVPRTNSEYLAKRIPNAELSVLEDVGHAIPSLDRDVISRTLAKLIDRSPWLAARQVA